MNANQYRAAVKRLEFKRTELEHDEGLTAAAQFFGANTRTGRRWAENGPPEAVAMFLRLMIKMDWKADDVRELLK